MRHERAMARPRDYKAEYQRRIASAERRGLITDSRLRRMSVISRGRSVTRTLSGLESASVNGQHLAAVREFLRTNDIALLHPFEGRFVVDAKGRRYLLETNPNALHRLASAGSEVFHDVYRLIQ